MKPKRKPVQEYLQPTDNMVAVRFLRPINSFSVGDIARIIPEMAQLLIQRGSAEYADNHKKRKRKIKTTRKSP